MRFKNLIILSLVMTVLLMSCSPSGATAPAGGVPNVSENTPDAKVTEAVIATPSYTLTPTSTQTPAPTDTFTITPTFTPTPQAISAENANQVILLNRLSDVQDIGNIMGSSLAFSPDGTLLAMGQYNAVRIIDVSTGLPFGQPITGLADWARQLDFSPDGTLLAAGLNEGTIYVWNVETGRTIWQPIDADIAAVNSVHFSPDSTLLASGNFDNKVNLWDVNTGQKVGEDLLGHTSWVNSVAFSPDGALLASGAQDGTARLWDVKSGQPVGQPLDHREVVSQVIFSPDGTLLITKAGKTIQFWDVKTGRLAGKPIQESTSIGRMALSPDGTLIVVGLLDAKLRIWDVRTRQPAAPPLVGHNDQYIESFITGIAFSPSGWWITSASGKNELFFWGVPRWDTTGTPNPASPP
jgi:WD40 repeat protein